MSKSKSNKTIDQNHLITLYMDYVLENDGHPVSVYKFCKHSEIEEEVFYNFFGSIDSIQRNIWDTFFSKTIEVMSASDAYDSMESRNKMLTFFYSFFEMLTLNRSYVLFVLKEHKVPLKNLGQLKGLRKHIKNFAKELISWDNEAKNFGWTKNSESLYSEGAWLQFLFLLKFWMNDDSVGFEKTDIAIEKSVNTIFDVFDNTPLNNVLDFGKFLWKESSFWN